MHVRGMSLWFNELHQRVYVGRLLVIERILHPEMRGRFANFEDIRNGPKYMVKLKRARLLRTVRLIFIGKRCVYLRAFQRRDRLA
jgi:hypothetical protein